MRSRFILWTFFVLFSLPFVFITDFFPFLRMGMFAEKVSKDTPQETYLVRFNGHRWSPDEHQLTPSTFNYLARNHYHRGETHLFLTKIATINEQNGHYSLYRMVLTGTANHDTTLVAAYEKRK